MNYFLATLGCVALLGSLTFFASNAAAAESDGQIRILRGGGLLSVAANPKNFTGTVRTDAIFSPQSPSRAYGAVVAFAPCARTDWHSHPTGQTLIVTSGRGYVQEQGKPAHEIHTGDTAWTPPDIVHWHGAAPDSSMTHIALSERIEDKAVAWGAKVTDQEYTQATAKAYRTGTAKEMPARLQKIALIAAFTASGDMERLNTVLVEGLEAGLTVNEIKEVLIHTYAYAGFPRTLNGINAFIAVMDAREKQGIKDVPGPEASPLVTKKSTYQYGTDTLATLRDPKYVLGKEGAAPKPRYEIFTPAIEVFLKEHLFADLFSRDTLDYLSREIATVGVISNLLGTNAQLRSHIGLAMTQGANEEQMRHLFMVMGTYLGKERGDNTLGVLQEVLGSKKK